ncbi:hypothetical protein [Bifidobacterium bombi]|nr:hypothetical protein [Bifidobacterium bombi]
MMDVSVHDTARIQGTLPDGYQLVFELWKRHSGGISKVTLNAAAKPVDVRLGATKVRSPEVSAGAGGYHWRERLIRPATTVWSSTPNRA